MAETKTEVKRDHLAIRSAKEIAEAHGEKIVACAFLRYKDTDFPEKDGHTDYDGKLVWYERESKAPPELEGKKITLEKVNEYLMANHASSDSDDDDLDDDDIGNLVIWTENMVFCRSEFEAADSHWKDWVYTKRNPPQS
ncbi:hypothetical protein KW783_03040 [Candidatus Parcubacteria bacterium]|nr:hypothetical protein [Candidatus Parcubacteria bacterium]